MRILVTITLMTICLTAIGQTSIDTESEYTRSNVKDVIVQNSYPKSGGDADEKCRYTDSTGKTYRYAIFWTRVVNETDTPLELLINFPAILPSPYSHIKLFLPTVPMTIDKESLYNYGITGLKSFSDTDFNNGILKRTINPKEESLLYIVLLSPLYHAGGTLRTGLVLKGKDLFYRISTAPQTDPALIPCGQIVYKNAEGR